MRGRDTLPPLELKEKNDSQVESLIARIKERARNLYLTHQLLCAEAVVMALNNGLNGGLSDSQVVAMTAPFCVALGESGCLCGALSGAVMASGLFLGNDSAYRNRRDMRNGARQLHDAFKSANGATCCSVLIRKVKHDRKAHFQQCSDLTAEAAELAARLILHKRPALITQADNGFLARCDSRFNGTLSRLFRLISSQ